MRCQLLVALALAGCLESSSIECADGTVCPADLVCAPVSGCATPEQVAACEEVAESGDCAVGEQLGVCRDGVCAALFCGDGLRTGNEQCDPEDGAASTCQDRGFYQGDEIGCAANCTWDTESCSEFCGDGTLQAPRELCEIEVAPAGTCVSFGFDAGRLGCAGCGADFSRCEAIGWTPASISGGAGLAVNDLASAGESLIAVGKSSSTLMPFAARWDGAWSPLGELAGVTQLEPFAVSALAADSVWVTGGDFGPGDGFVAHWDGAAWQADSIPARGVAIWARAADDVFVLAGTGVHHFDGDDWSFTELDPFFIGRVIWGRADGSALYAAGESGELYRFEGSGWDAFDRPPGQSVLDLAETPDGVIWAASMADGVYWWNGSEWKDAKLPVSLEDAELHVDSDGQVFVLASWSGPAEAPNWEVMHYRGGYWHVLTDPIAGGLVGVGVRTFGGFGRQMLLFAAHEGFRYGGSTWWDVSPGDTLLPSAGTAFAAGGQIWVTPPSPGPIFHADGGQWSELAISGNRVDGVGANDVYVLDSGNDELSHWNGIEWTTGTVGAINLSRLAVRGRDDVYLITGVGSRLQHWDGSDLTVVDGTNAIPLFDVDCLPGGLCVAVGSTGRWWSNDSDVQAPTTSSLNAVWIAPNGELFVGGDDGEIWRWDGDWLRMATDRVDPIDDLGGTSATDVFALMGQGERLLHFDGAETHDWEPVRTRMHEGALSFVGSLARIGDELLLIGRSPTVVRLERTYPW